MSCQHGTEESKDCLLCKDQGVFEKFWSWYLLAVLVLFSGWLLWK